MHLTANRLVSALFLGGLTLATLAASEPAQPGIPVVPTVPPPQPPAGHPIRARGVPAGQEKNNGAQPEPTVVETGPQLSLGECISIALERHPSIKAAQASAGATQVGSQALGKFGTVGTILSPDLDIRKQQAQRGMIASAADYQKVRDEAVQDVTRMYYTAVYAKQQEAIGKDVAGQLEELIKIAEVILKEEPNPKNLEGLTQGKILAMKIGLREVRGKIAEARIGRQRAMAALRQLMAVDEKSFPFRLKDTELPLMAQQVPVTKELVVEQALCRRPELALAAAGLDAFRLEVYAQGKIPFRRVVPTFASGADLHSKDIPPAMRGKEYRPGAVTPELPPQLVGSKTDRVNRAMAYAQRAEAVFDSARTLVTLEAENGFLEFELATEKLRLQKESLDLALQARDLARQQQQNVKDKSVIVQAEILAAKAESDYLTAALDHLLALSALERITAGGIRPAFPGR